MAHNHRYDDTSTIQDYADVDFSTIDPKDWHRYTIRPGYQHDFGNKRGRWRRWDREFPALAIPVDAAALASSIETYATIEPSYKAFLEFAADENSRIGQLPVEVALRIKRLLCHRETADIWYARMACKSGNCDHGHLVPPATNLDEVSHWVNETHLICEDEDGCDGCADHLFRCWEARTRITLQPGRFSRVLAWGNRQWPTKAQGDEVSPAFAVSLLQNMS